MQTLKYAMRNVMRSKGRSILIGIIVVIIAFAVCISLCIRQSSVDARDEALSNMTITATISPDRDKAMDKAMGDSEGGQPQQFDKDKLPDMMEDELSLSELKKYSKASSVKSFYYTMTADANAAGKLEAYSTTDDSDSQGGGPSMEGMGSQGDFTITGYSSDEAMTDFVDGKCSVEDGKVFDEGTDEKVCLISNELAKYNDLEVGDTIKLSGTDDDDSTFKLKIVGIYKNSQASADAGGMRMGGFSDPANNIYMSYNALEKIVDDSDGELSGRVEGTYVLGTVEAYEAFEKEVTELGLSDDYVVSSSDIEAYEQSAEPLENLSKFAGYFVAVVLGIGAVILIVFNIFATRERKYEIGVLTAIGMKKKKVAAMFVSEILVITLCGVIVGGGIGMAVSAPVTNGLLSTSVASQQQSKDDMKDNFGREAGGGQMPGGNMQMPDQSQPDDADSVEKAPQNTGTVSEVSGGVSVSVVLKLLGACVVLALISGAVSVVTIMRYEPLEILSRRD